MVEISERIDEDENYEVGDEFICPEGYDSIIKIDVERIPVCQSPLEETSNFFPLCGDCKYNPENRE